MRMRKLPWAEEYLQDAEVVIKDPSQLKGRWRTLVHGEKLHLEIGCGKGDYWNQMAKRYPQDGWKLEEFSVDYRREPHEEDVITEYEKRFLSAGQPIYRAVWSRGSEEVAK